MGTREDFLGAYELVRSGRARVHVDRVFPLAEIRAAHERLEAGEQLGKIVLVDPVEPGAGGCEDPVERVGRSPSQPPPCLGTPAFASGRISSVSAGPSLPTTSAGVLD